MKGEKETLAKANIDATQRMETAFKGHDEIKGAFLKLDEARFVLNRIMGPQGTMAENERKMYLNNNLDEHDKLVRNSKDANNQLTASVNINPIHSVQGAALLNNNPSKAYFGQAGIAGNNGTLQQSLSRGQAGRGLGSQSNLASPAQNPAKATGAPQSFQADQRPYPDNQADDDDFWYQTPADAGNANDFAGGQPGSLYGQQNRLY